ncbi:MAG: LD-carboxypeptidase [Planctomycetota bacterium]
MTQRLRIHLIAPAGSCRPFFEPIGVRSAAELVALAQEAVGGTYQVRANEAILEAAEDESRGGRIDDRLRAEDLQQALADPDVVAVVALRGGAWFTRILPLIDFTVLDRRKRRVAAFGFSELTSLVNIVGAHPRGLGVYGMGPAFLTYGMKRHAASQLHAGDLQGVSPEEWMLQRLREEFFAFFRNVTSTIEGRGGVGPLLARRVHGELPRPGKVRFIGGNLTVFSAMIGSRYQECIRPKGRWVVLEDFNDKPERFDRFLAHLTLAGYWEECEGVLLGDFHLGERDLTEAMLAILSYHLPRGGSFPVLVTSQVGHVWPMTPLPLHVPATLERADETSVSIRWPAAALCVV